MSDVFLCDCCGEILDVDFRNRVTEVLTCWFESDKFEAEDDVCDHCLEEILRQVYGEKRE